MINIGIKAMLGGTFSPLTAERVDRKGHNKESSEQCEARDSKHSLTRHLPFL